jgi:hypothetical protein
MATDTTVSFVYVFGFVAAVLFCFGGRCCRRRSLEVTLPRIVVKPVAEVKVEALEVVRIEPESCTEIEMAKES